MTEQKSGDTAPTAGDEPKASETEKTPPTEKKASGETDGNAPPSREQAMQNLRGEASTLSSVKFGKIIAEGTSRLEGEATVNVFQVESFSVAGDFLAGGGGGRRPASRRQATVLLDQDILAEEDGHFVPPPGFEHGVDTLGDGNLLILSGPARAGRRSRAQATLLAALRRVQAEPVIFQLNSPVLGNTSWRIPQPNCGLLVVDRPGKDGKFGAEAVNDAWLTDAAKRLAERDSFLVVVTGPVRDKLATASRRAEYVLEDLELPDPMEIVRRRVCDELLWDPEDLDARLAETELEGLLADRDDPRFATRAAASVIEALRNRADLAEAVAKLSNPEEQVREWLERDPDLADIAFVMATAVLEGASYLSVADAAVSLYRALSSSSGVTTLRYLKDLLAERRWIECVGRPGGDDGAPMLRFRHARLRPVVLALTWFEFDGARPKILDWLKTLAEHTDVEVRARAAQAAGILASNDFEHGMHGYFLPWALDRSFRLRQSAASALNIAGTLGGHTESAWSYVEQWTESVGSATLRTNLLATAGLTVGGQLGVDRPRRALRILRTLVREGNWGLLESVAVSTQTLLEAGRGEEILDALLEWTDGPSTDETVEKALHMFAFAVSPEEDEQPLLMRTAYRHRDALQELWGRALGGGKEVRKLALAALRDWLRVADADESARGVVVGVVADIADRSNTDFERMAHATEKWAEDPDDPSAVAGDCHHLLAEVREEAS